MNDKIKRFAFYNIFFLCAFISLFMVLNLNSFGYYNNYSNIVTETDNGNGYGRTGVWTFGDASPVLESDTVFAAVKVHLENASYSSYALVAYSPSIDIFQNYNASWVGQKLGSWSGSFDERYYSSALRVTDNTFNHIIVGYTFPITYFSTRFPQYDSIEDFLNNWGNANNVPFDASLKLDSFKVTSWQIGTSQLIFRSKFVVTWSDERIANVQVKIVGTANSPASFEANQSPFKQKFYADNYVMKNGDVIHLTATPFTSNGEYGESLYYSLIYDDHLPSNWYRKFVNTPYNDNTLTIPYNNVSGQPQSVTLPVDGVTTQNVYKVNYNPVTNEYGDLNLYNIYYSPVLVYPDETPEDEIDETQEVVNNQYTTNNYYETTKNFNFDFDVSFGDISGSDIQIGYDNTGNFLNFFGDLISKLSSWVLALFPFLPPIVATSIVVVFGLVVSVAIIAFALKIASVIADFIDAIIPG